jgi:late competence protein required for DNA uptake (superfamily II DNA/RNA helicase)
MKLTPRDYQQEAVDSLHKHFKRSKKGLLVLPTGAGKTFTAWLFLKDYVQKGEKILWVVHRDYLIPQCIDGIKANNIDCNVTQWTAKEKDSSGDVVIAMVMSTRELTNDFDWVVYDECHRSAAQSYKLLEDRISYKKKLGLSATPSRLDEKDLDLGKIVYQVEFKDLVEKGYLAQPDIRIIKTGQRFQFTISGGDISRRSLGAVNNAERNLAIFKEVFERDISDRKILIFAVNIKHAEAIKALADSYRSNSCGIVHSKQSVQEKKKSLEDFALGNTRILCNVEVFTEGYDQKDITDVVMARPTVSRALWTQMVGRGARIIPGKKSDFTLWLPVDDVNKSYWLMQDWCLTNADFDVEQRNIVPSEYIANVDEAIAEFDTPIDLSPSEKLITYGFVEVNPNFENAKQRTFVITKDRYKCLKILSYYYSNSDPEDNLKDYIELSYAICCINGEFTVKEWKELAWSYYFYKIKGRKLNKFGLPTFRFIKVSDPEFTDDYIAESYDRNLDLCNEVDVRFGELAQKYGSIRQLFQVIQRESHDYMPSNSRWLFRSIRDIKFKNRSLVIQTYETSFMPSMTRFTEGIAYILGQMIQDDNIIVHTRLDNGY